MKCLLLASAAVVALIAPARAQMAVIDAATLVQAAQTAAHGAEQVAQLTQQIAIMQQQYAQLMQTYQAIAHVPDAVVRSLGDTFAVPSLRSPVPGQAADLAGIVGGLSNGGSLGSQMQSILGANRIYSPVGQDPAALAMTTNANSIAGTQAMVQQLYQSATDHASALWTLEGQLSNAPDAKATADIQARLQMEQAQLQARQIQAQTLGTAQQAQVRQTAQQHEESRRCYIDAILNGSDPNVDNCARPASQGSVQLAAAGTAGGASVASGYEKFVGQSVGSGQCVALVQQADSSVGLTATWTQGAQVQGNTDLAPGTAIATFDGSGKYANATDGSSHAAIYLGQDAAGNIQVEDQWLGHPASVRTIRASGSTQANSGSAFYVIGHGGA